MPTVHCTTQPLLVTVFSTFVVVVCDGREFKWRVALKFIDPLMSQKTEGNSWAENYDLSRLFHTTTSWLTNVRVQLSTGNPSQSVHVGTQGENTCHAASAPLNEEQITFGGIILSKVHYMLFGLGFQRSQ